jgi:hypothetical protein
MRVKWSEKKAKTKIKEKKRRTKKKNGTLTTADGIRIQGNVAHRRHDLDFGRKCALSAEKKKRKKNEPLLLETYCRWDRW